MNKSFKGQLKDLTKKGPNVHLRETRIEENVLHKFCSVEIKNQLPEVKNQSKYGIFRQTQAMGWFRTSSNMLLNGDSK